MHDDRYNDLKKKIKADFSVIDEKYEKDEERHQEIETIEFNGPLGLMKTEWITRPKVLDKKTTYSNRVGGDVSVEYIYSEDEVTHTFKIYKKEGSIWQEISADSFV